MNPLGQSITEALHTITLYIYIYIYRKEMNPPGQLITEDLHTITLHIYIYIYIYICIRCRFLILLNKS